MKRYLFKNNNDFNGHMMEVLNSLGGKGLDYNWLVTDIETYFLDDDYLFLSTKELFDLIEKNNDPQWIWGVFSAIPNKYSKEEVLKYDFPFANDHRDLWKEAIIQHPLADIEIISYDSTFLTIVSRSDKYLEMLRKTFSSLKEDEYV